MRFLSVLLLLLAVPVAAQLQPCADNGESSSTRTIRATSGTQVALAKVPKRLRDGIVGSYVSFMFGNRAPAGAAESVKVTAARKYTFGTITFYAVTIGSTQTIVSTACPNDRCSRDWWPADAKILADLDHAPSAVPGDEFYLVSKDTPKGRAALLTAESTSDEYELVETCLVTLTTEAAQAEACAPDAFTLCLLDDRFAITATRRAGGGHQPASVGARGEEAGTFGLVTPEYWDVLVSLDEHCRATKTFILKYVSMSTDPYDLTVTDTTTGITRTFSKTGPPADPFRYDNTTFRCQ